MSDAYGWRVTLERAGPDDSTDELIDLMDRYKAAVAHVILQARGSPEHSAALRAEEALSRQIHQLVTDQRLGLHH